MSGSVVVLAGMIAVSLLESARRPARESVRLCLERACRIASIGRRSS